MKELCEYLRLRGRLYKLLGLPYFRESTVIYLKELKKYLPVLETFANEASNAGMKEGTDTLGDFFEKYSDLHEVIDSHERHFVRLFLNVTAQNTKEKSINAQESCYLSPCHLSRQDEWEEVYRMMCEEGVGKSDGNTELEDHITSEFHFMALLSSYAADALENNDEKTFTAKLVSSGKLMDQHIAKWVPLMCRDLMDEAAKLLEEASSVYFIGLAKLTSGFVECDRAFLKELLQ